MEKVNPKSKVHLLLSKMVLVMMRTMRVLLLLVMWMMMIRAILGDEYESREILR